MLARLGEFPVGVFGADWTLLSWTPAWAVLLGDPSARTPVERNLARAVFAAGPSGLAAWPVLQDGDAMTPALVADLRTALVNYPGAIVQVGAVTCDCEVLTVPGCDVRLVVYTVAAGSADAEKLEFPRGTNGVRADGPSPPGPAHGSHHGRAPRRPTRLIGGGWPDTGEAPAVVSRSGECRHLCRTHQVPPPQSPSRARDQPDSPSIRNCPHSYQPAPSPPCRPPRKPPIGHAQQPCCRPPPQNTVGGPATIPADVTDPKGLPTSRPAAPRQAISSRGTSQRERRAPRLSPRRPSRRFTYSSTAAIPEPTQRSTRRATPPKSCTIFPSPRISVLSKSYTTPTAVQ
ncbi:MmyB family transcriptional regulator [Streptomyces bluensis]|uniref:MmyB family transcriptional regulator n=1 Tax=Streptomyces bluensis TaxID=33897 RepID=UPI0019BD7848|nr:hypothetical protein [Streptomyces bluensis]GGZ87180.1 hypothetical protein GCM10010344_63440 [Streptomyces bluensis]